MKRFLSLLICIAMLFALTIPVTADTPKIVDRAGILTGEEVSLLEQKARDIVSQYDMDVVIVVEENIDGSDVTVFADDYYDGKGYGIGENFSGVLLLIVTDTREWAMSTCGDAIYALTDYGMELLFDAMDDYLAEDDYYRAFDAYLDELPVFFAAYENGDPIDGEPDMGYDGPGYIDPADRDEIIYHPDYDPEPDLGDYLRIVFVSLAIGAAVGGIVILIMRGQMNTARQQSGAASYLVNGSYDLKRHQDIFLYSRVSRTRRAENNHSSGGGHRGGSSVHRSASGRSHGGRSGRF